MVGRGRNSYWLSLLWPVARICKWTRHRDRDYVGASGHLACQHNCLELTFSFSVVQQQIQLQSGMVCVCVCVFSVCIAANKFYMLQIICQTFVHIFCWPKTTFSSPFSPPDSFFFSKRKITLHIVNLINVYAANVSFKFM